MERRLQKCRIWMLIAALFLLLAACKDKPVIEETQPPIESEVYWNPGNHPEQKPDAEGYYSITLFANGERETFKTRFKLLLDKIDALEVLGLGFDEAGYVSMVYEVSRFTGGLQTWSVTESLVDGMLKTDKGTLSLAAGAALFQVTNEGALPMQTETVQLGDRVLAVLDAEGKATHLFVRDRHSQLAVTETCGHEDVRNDWINWDGTAPFADGGYYKLTADITVGEKDSVAIALDGITVHLCLNGHTLTAAGALLTVENGARFFLCDHQETGGKVIASGLNGDNGSILFGKDKDCGIYLYHVELEVAQTGKARPTRGHIASGDGTLYFENCSLSGGNTTSGAASVYCGANTFLVMKNCTVTSCRTDGRGAISNVSGKCFLNNVCIGGFASPKGKEDIYLNSNQAVVLDGVTCEGIYVLGGSAEFWGKLTAARLYVSGGNYVWVGGMQADSSIAVSPSMSGKFATGVKSELTGCFTSLDAAYSLISEEGALFAERGDNRTHTATHCYCGGKAAKIGDHTKCESLQWKPLNWSELTATDECVQFADSGAYYIENVFSLGKPLEIREGQTITLCLNGGKMQAEALGLRVYGILNLCDCKKTGSIVAQSSAGIAQVYCGGALNIFSGKLTASTDCTARLIALLDDEAQTGKASYVSIYGGSLVGNGRLFAENGGVLCGMSKQSVITLYAGTVSGGNTAKQGGNIFTNGILHILGGKITDGVATGYGSGVALGNGAKVTLSGKPVIEKNYHSSGEYESNLFLMNKSAAQFGKLEKGAWIGISAPLGVFAENVQKDITAYLFSDIRKMEIMYTNKKLNLRKIE